MRIVPLLACLAVAGCAQLASGQTSTAPVVNPGHGTRGDIRAITDPGNVTGTYPRSSCRFRDHGQLPDPRCTPGAYDPRITAGKLCSGSYSIESYRPSESQTERFKYDVAYPAYGVPDSATSELDHLIPLELGGSNSSYNLWPEVGPLPNPKDRVEDALHNAVCAGKVSLRKAQIAIARNWITAEHKLGLN
jgi:hypothetical protein